MVPEKDHSGHRDYVSSVSCSASSFPKSSWGPLFRDLTVSELSADFINIIFYKYPFHVRHLFQNDDHLAENSKFQGYVLFPSLITAEVGFLSFCSPKESVETRTLTSTIL